MLIPWGMVAVMARLPVISSHLPTANQDGTAAANCGLRAWDNWKLAKQSILIWKAVGSLGTR
jgi:hypothetical protein